MKVFFIICLVMTLTGTAMAQTYIPITNNMQIGDFSNIKFIPNNYVFNDTIADGVIQINGKHNIVLDGDSCRVNGIYSKGYMIKITNSHHIVIKNFDSVFGYKYAVHIMNSDHITINGNVFCRNRVDSSGWIDVLGRLYPGFGGGVMMYQSRAAHIFNNIMTKQNDGVALYHCDSVNIHDNDFHGIPPMGYGCSGRTPATFTRIIVQMSNRPKTDPSDCAALLMIVSNANRVENNDLSYSGDGVFSGSTRIQQSRTTITLPGTNVPIPRIMPSKLLSPAAIFTSTTTATTAIMDCGWDIPSTAWSTAMKLPGITMTASPSTGAQQ